MSIQLPSINPQEPQSGRVAAPATSAPTVDPGAFTRGISQGERQISETASMLQELRAREQTVNAQRSVLATSDSFQQAFDAPGGFLETIGSQTTEESMAAAFKRVDADIAKHRDALSSDYERELFDDAVARKRSVYQQQAVEHFSKQLKVREVGGLQAQLTGDVNEAIRAHAGGADAFRRASRTAVETGQALAKRIGIDGAQRKEFMLRLTDQIHGGVVRQLLTLDDGTAAQQAREYLAGVPADQLDPDTLLQLDDLIDRQGLQDATRAHAAQLLSDRTRAAQDRALKDAAESAAATAVNEALDIGEAPVIGDRSQGPQPNFADVYRARRVEWEQRVQAAYQAADAQKNPEYRDALRKELDAAVTRHDKLLARAKNEARQQAEDWIEAQPVGPVEWAGAPVELQQQAIVHGLVGELTTLGRTRVKASNEAIRAGLYGMGPDELRTAFPGGPADAQARFGGDLDKGDMTWLMSRIADAYKQGAGDPTEKFISDHAEQIATETLKHRVNPKDPVDTAAALKIRDALVRKIELDRMQRVEKQRPVDKLVDELKVQAPWILSPDKPMVGPHGREITPSSILIDPLRPGEVNPRVLKRAAEEGRDPADPIAMFTIGEELLEEDRQMRVKALRRTAEESGVRVIPGFPGFVRLQDAAARTGLSADELVTWAREAAAARGADESEFVREDASWGRAGYPAGLQWLGQGWDVYKNRPAGISWDALEYLARRDPSIADKLK